jgi:hypothetical protein
MAKADRIEPGAIVIDAGINWPGADLAVPA